MIGLTPLQARALRAIRILTKDGVPPSYDEIREHLEYASVGVVHRLLHQLRDRGAITFEPGRARSIRILGSLDGLEERTTADLVALKARIDQILERRAA